MNKSSVEASSQPARILIVDDQKTNIDILKDILSDYDRRIALNGEQVLKVVESDNPPDLVLLDIMMPGMDGYEVCRRMKSDPATRDIPVIFVTAKTRVEDEIRGFELGAVDYITKPVSEPIVQARVSNHLSLLNIRRALESRNRDLLDRERYIRSLIDQSMDIIISMDAKFKIVEFNAAAQKAFGRKAEDVYGQSPASLFIDPNKADQIDVLVESRGSFSGEVACRAADGKAFPVLWTMGVLKDDNDVRSGVICLGRDIGMEKKLRDMMQRKREQDVARHALGGVRSAVMREVESLTTLRTQLESSVSDDVLERFDQTLSQLTASVAQK
ncbi:MAG: response regulator [Magnetococcales bacterium]|nr:response regulator [Magnetococcales bacterium]